MECLACMNRSKPVPRRWLRTKLNSLRFTIQFSAWSNGSMSLEMNLNCFLIGVTDLLFLLPDWLWSEQFYSARPCCHRVLCSCLFWWMAMTNPLKHKPKEILPLKTFIKTMYILLMASHKNQFIYSCNRSCSKPLCGEALPKPHLSLEAVGS